MTIRIAGMGDNVVDCYTAAGLMFPGGNTLNVSVFAARAGAESAYFGQVADDRAGVHIARSLEAEGVDCTWLRFAPGDTAHCLIGHDEDGDRVFISFDLGVSRFVPTGDDLAALRTFDTVHVGATSGLDDHVAALAEVTRLSYDFSTHREPQHIASIGSLCHLAIHSGGDLDDDDFEDLIRRSEDSGASWSLITRGTRGAVLSHQGTRWAGMALDAGPTIDTLGAGDSFAARVLVGILRSEDPQALLTAAAKTAAETCARLGAFGHGVPIDAHERALPQAPLATQIPLTNKEHR